MKDQQRTPNRMRIFNKYIINRLTRSFARFPRGPFALIYHIGRRSGKPYETPIMIEPIQEDFVIALTYGESVDWYRNVLASGHCTVLWHGRTYALGKPEPIALQEALPAFPPFLRFILGILGTQHFVRMKSQ